MIKYEDAMRELGEMFPEVDREVLAVILRDNKGHLERTIDQILVLRGDKPINDEAFVRDELEAQDLAIAQDLQRRILVHDMVRERVLAEQMAGPGLFPSGHQPRVPDDEPEAGEEVEDEESETWKEFKEKWGKLSESAKLKMREWWSRLKPNPAAAGTARYAPVAAAAATTTTGDGDDEQVAFDSSLSRRLKPVPAAELDVLAAMSPSAAAATTVPPPPPATATTTTATTTQQTGKKKDD